MSHDFDQRVDSGEHCGERLSLWSQNFDSNIRGNCEITKDLLLFDSSLKQIFSEFSMNHQCDITEPAPTTVFTPVHRSSVIIKILLFFLSVVNRRLSVAKVHTRRRHSQRSLDPPKNVAIKSTEVARNICCRSSLCFVVKKKKNPSDSI